MQRLAIMLGSALSVIVLLRWAGKRSQRRAHRFDPLRGLCGSGRQIWADEHADEDVARLREG